MNKIDKRFYKALRFLSKMPTKNAYDKYMNGNWEGSEKHCNDDTLKDLKELGYIEPPDKRQMLSSKGMDQLRMLEDMRRKDFTLIASVVAVMLSLISLAKSFFF